MKISFCFLALIFASLFWGCGQDRLAGGEILNPPGKQVLTGIILDSESRPAFGAEVRAYPLDYDPVVDSGTIRSGWLDTALSDGSFSLSGLDTVAVNLWVVDRKHGTLMLIRSVKPGSAGNITAGHVLKSPGALSLAFPEVTLKTESYVYMQGTPIFKRLSHLVGVVSPRAILDSIPEGLCPPLRLVVSRSPETLKLLGTDLRVNSLDTINLSILPEWRDYTRIFLRHEGLGAGLTAGLHGYPLLVRLDSANFPFRNARADGSDLRFSTKSGNSLPYEIESYDSAASKAAIWVRLDTLRPIDPNQFIRMYWGNSTAVSESNGPAVFDSVGKYAGVWHLRFQAAKGDASLRDASNAKNDGFLAGNPSGLQNSDSHLGGSASFDGSGAAILTPRLYTRPGDMTVSIWFKTTSDSGGRLIGFNKWKTELDSVTFRDRHIWMDDSGKVHFGIYHSKVSADSAKRVLGTSKAFNDGFWHMATATLSASAGIELFVDGQSYGTDAAGTVAQAFDGYWRMGYETKFIDWPAAPSASSFRGWLDEARVSYQPFSVEKIRLDYQTQKLGSRIVEIEAP